MSATLRSQNTAMSEPIRFLLFRTAQESTRAWTINTASPGTSHASRNSRNAFKNADIALDQTSLHTALAPIERALAYTRATLAMHAA